jgi:peptide/nickel transport system permease protein
MTAVAIARRPAASPLRRAGRHLQRRPWRIPLYLVLVVLALCGVAPGLIAPQDPLAQDILNRNLPPFSHPDGGPLYLLGTDPLGRDVLTRMIYGARTSLLVAFASVAGAFLVGVPLGMVAGYFRGWIDSTSMRFVDAVLSFPPLVLAIFVLYLTGPSVVNLVLVLAATRWMIFARVARGLAIDQRGLPYVAALQAIGCSSGRILVRHLLPNTTQPLLSLACLEFAYVILGSAGLSFLGVGVQPPTADWGLMVAEGQSYLATAWWLVALPGCAIFVTTVTVRALAGNDVRPGRGS